MAKYSVYALVLAAVLAIMVRNGNCQPASGKCGENEVMKCTECEPTCDNVAGGWTPKMCITSCTQGCVCKAGLVRNSEKKCVHTSECPCKENSYYTKGGCVDKCQPTCPNQSVTCIQECKEGCNCNEGFVRLKEGGDCVRPEACPKPPAP